MRATEQSVLETRVREAASEVRFWKKRDAMPDMVADVQRARSDLPGAVSDAEATLIDSVRDRMDEIIDRLRALQDRIEEEIEKIEEELDELADRVAGEMDGGDEDAANDDGNNE
jgi:hypothetical protein